MLYHFYYTIITTVLQIIKYEVFHLGWFCRIWHSLSYCLSRSLDLTKACLVKPHPVTPLLVVTLISQPSLYFGFHIMGGQQFKISYLKINILESSPNI